MLFDEDNIYTVLECGFEKGFPKNPKKKKKKRSIFEKGFGF